MNETRRSSSRIKTIESNKAAVRQRKKEEALAAAAVAVKKPAKKQQRVKDTGGDVSAGSAVGEVYAEGKGAGHGGEYEFEEETRCRKADDEKLKKPNVKAKKGEESCKSEEDEKTSPKKQKSKNKDEVEEKSKSKRPDLKSLSFMQKSNLTLVPKNRIGSIRVETVDVQLILVIEQSELQDNSVMEDWIFGLQDGVVNALILVSSNFNLGKRAFNGYGWGIAKSLAGVGAETVVLTWVP
ncbi:hypothetical protein Tco_0553878, partial [Tanacetum coccineum]